MKPDFLCIGAQKAGTTWLYRMLQQHPEFDLPPIKEIHYFDRSSHYTSPSHLNSKSRLRRFRNPHHLSTTLAEFRDSFIEKDYSKALWTLKYRFGNYNDEWYLNLFKNTKGITGDITPAYSMLQSKDVQAIANLIPEVKIIFLIRNPIDRAWSMFRFMKRMNPGWNVENLDGFKDFIESPFQSLRGDYLATIKRFTEYFKKENILIGFYDAIAENPNEMLRSILQHLGARDIEHSLNSCTVFNSSPREAMPETYKDYLKNHYAPQIRELSRLYGSYAKAWEYEICHGTACHPFTYPTNMKTTFSP